MANFLSMTVSADDTLGAIGEVTTIVANFPLSVIPWVSVTIKL